MSETNIVVHAEYAQLEGMHTGITLNETEAILKLPPIVEYISSNVSTQTMSTAVDEIPSMNSTDEQAEKLCEIEATCDPRQCWICFKTEYENHKAAWIHPCKCRGSLKWVHMDCLLKWVDENQRHNMLQNVGCPHCQYKYLISYPKMGNFAQFLEIADHFIKRASFPLAIFVISFFIYCMAGLYGAFTIIQIFGYRKGYDILKSDMHQLFTALPIIPLGLFLSRFISWDDALVNLIGNPRKFARKYPMLQCLVKLRDTGTEENVLDDSLDALLDDSLDEENNFEKSYVCRMFIGAMFLPTIAVWIGYILFSFVENPLLEAFLGGLVFILIKGFLKIYFKLKVLKKNKCRTILDYEII